jgi:hypothetical protein
MFISRKRLENIEGELIKLKNLIKMETTVTTEAIPPYYVTWQENPVNTEDYLSIKQSIRLILEHLKLRIITKRTLPKTEITIEPYAFNNVDKLDNIK